MKGHEVKQTATAWVEANRAWWAGLQAAHLVGSAAGAPAEAEFPAYKDVDVHLIFEEGAPMLIPQNPFAHLVETEYEGLLIEAGLKPSGDYGSPEAVLANPEIADHVRV